MDERFTYGHAAHAAYRRADAARQLDFFAASLRADGGFDTLDFAGKPLPYAAQQLHTTTRLVHSCALARRRGFDGHDAIVDAGLQALWHWHRDSEHGGYFWAVRGSRAVDDVKLAYGHVFVLLAGASALLNGHAHARRVLDDASAVIDRHYWEDDAGRLRDEFNRDWTPFSNYRGMNANMHGTEALLAAFQATGEARFLERAGRILDFFLGRMAPQYGWRIPEHYDDSWRVDPDYEGDPMFRPRGTTPGHSFEFARLNLEYRALAGEDDDARIETSARLVDTALADAWHENGGIVYTLTLDGAVDRPARYWWPVTEAIGALAALLAVRPNDAHADWYARLWAFADQYLIDHERGGWYPEVDAQNRPATGQFDGKPDIYHALQADLLPG